MNVLGVEVTEKTRREVLLRLVYRLIEIEPHFTAREIALARRISVERVKEHMRTGRIRGAQKDGATNDWTAPLSAIREYDEAAAVALQRDREPIRLPSR